ncbi:ankyrin repeat domain-containing protein [Cupriavidus sp. 2MCAB6]|uniref:ankyrin repeat domain-containing protein n=1 Tax=Cupriavidus sp. 2MCAB6 TaxID=3232981 RepID=UPI003F915C01
MVSRHSPAASKLESPNEKPLDSPIADAIFRGAILDSRLDAVAEFINMGVDVNAQDREGMTALHHAVALGARPSIRLLVNSGRCDYLIKDNYGRYPSDIAIEWARDYAVGRLLSKKQAMQAYLQSSQPDHPANGPFRS